MSQNDAPMTLDDIIEETDHAPDGSTQPLRCRPECLRCQLESYASRERERRKMLVALRELSEKATAGPWKYSHWKPNKETYTRHGIVGAGQVFMARSQASGDIPDWQFIVACVNYVRTALLDEDAAGGKGAISKEK